MDDGRFDNLMDSIMDTHRIRAIDEAIRTKERFEGGLEFDLADESLEGEAKLLQQDYLTKIRPNFDYKAEFVNKLLGRINPRINNHLQSNDRAQTYNESRFRSVCKKNPEIKNLFSLLEKHIFPYTNEGNFGVMHGDMWWDNFCSFDNRLNVIDLESVYLKGKPQHSLWYILGTSVPDHQERLGLADHFLKVSFEERYGALDEDNFADFDDYKEGYHRIDLAQSMLHVVRQLNDVKDSNSAQAVPTLEYIKERSTHLGIPQLYDAYESVLRKFIDPTHEDTATYLPTLFPDESINNRTEIKSLRRDLKWKETKEKGLEKLMKWVVKPVATTAGALGLVYAGLNLISLVDPHDPGGDSYQKKHKMTDEVCYSYSEKAPFDLLEVLVNKTTSSRYCNHKFNLPELNREQESELTLVLGKGGEIQGQRIDLALINPLTGRRVWVQHEQPYTPRSSQEEEESKLTIPFTPPKDIPFIDDFGYLEVKIEDHSTILFEGLYAITMEKAPEGFTEQRNSRNHFLNCFYRHIRVAEFSADRKTIAQPGDRVEFTTRLEDAKTIFSYDDEESLSTCFLDRLLSNPMGVVRLSNGLESRVPIRRNGVMMPIVKEDENGNSYFEMKSIDERDANWYFEGGKPVFKIEGLSFMGYREEALSASLYLQLPEINEEVWLASTKIAIPYARDFPGIQGQVPNNAGKIEDPFATRMGRKEDNREHEGINPECEIARSKDRSLPYISTEANSSLELHCKNNQLNSNLESVLLRVRFPQLEYVSTLGAYNLSADKMGENKFSEAQEWSGNNATGKVHKINGKFARIVPNAIQIQPHFETDIEPGIYQMVIEYFVPKNSVVKEKYTTEETQPELEHVNNDSYFGYAFMGSIVIGEGAPQEAPIQHFIDKVRQYPKHVVCQYEPSDIASASRLQAECIQMLEALKGKENITFDYADQVQQRTVPAQIEPGAVNIMLGSCYPDFFENLENVSTLEYTYGAFMHKLFKHFAHDGGNVLFACTRNTMGSPQLHLDVLRGVPGTEDFDLNAHTIEKSYEGKWTNRYNK
jgi:hypothetical protein